MWVLDNLVRVPKAIVKCLVPAILHLATDQCFLVLIPAHLTVPMVMLSLQDVSVEPVLAICSICGFVLTPSHLPIATVTVNICNIQVPAIVYVANIIIKQNHLYSSATGKRRPPYVIIT